VKLNSAWSSRLSFAWRTFHGIQSPFLAICFVVEFAIAYKEQILYIGSHFNLICALVEPTMITDWPEGFIGRWEEKRRWPMIVHSAKFRFCKRSLFSLVVSAAVLAMMLPRESFSQQVTVLKNVTVIDGEGHQAQRSRIVVIKGDRIQSIADATARIPSHAKIVDMNGKTIMPLIINTHGHVGLTKGTTQSADNQTEENFRHQLLRYEQYGVGAVLSMGTDGKRFADLRAESRSGALPGAMLFTGGIGLGVKDAVPPLSMGFTGVFRPATPAEAREDVAQQASLKPDVLKMWVDDFYGQFTPMKPEIYKAIIDEAHKRELRVAVHVYHLEDARNLINAGVDIIAHSVRDGEIDDALLAQMKKQHVVYIPTLSLDDFAIAYQNSPSWINDQFFRAALDPGVLEMINTPKYNEQVRANKVTAIEAGALPIAMKNLKRVYDSGVLVSLGTDSGASPVRAQGFAEHMELVLMVQAGLTPLQAIEVATRNGAEVLRIADQCGTLSRGKKASFIVLEKDPSLDIHNTQTIKAIWKDGKKVSDGPLS
jgi:imidazolonepropionase-like amidohydrolase